MKELALKIKELLKREYPDNYVNVWHSFNLGETINIKFAIEPEKDRNFGIYMNATYVTAIIFREANDLYSFDIASGRLKVRKKNNVSSEQILKHVQQQFAKVTQPYLKKNV